MSSVRKVGLFHIHTNLPKKQMIIEQIIPAVVAIITGGGFLINRLHHRITELDRRVDKIELMVATSYVPRNEADRIWERLDTIHESTNR